MRLARPEERHGERMALPRTEWDLLCSLIIVYRQGDIPVARACLDQHANGKQEMVRALLEVWAAEVPDDSCFNWQYREMEYIDNVLPGTRSCREA